MVLVAMVKVRVRSTYQDVCVCVTSKCPPPTHVSTLIGELDGFSFRQ